MPQKNKIQAHIPAGAKALTNNLGTAPGIVAESKGKLFFSMPGVPSEMKAMFKEAVLPQLEKLTTDQVVVVQKLKCFGTGESNIAELLGDLCTRGRNPLINSTVHAGVITLHIIAAAQDKDTAHRMANDDEKLLRTRLGRLIFGTNEQTLAEVVGQKLIQQKKTLAVAESCTGGCLAKLLTNIPGASKYFTHGWVTYSNSAKISELGVSHDLIAQHGAVSEQVASAMARGARKKSQADFAIAITGIAGPSGATEQKPLGLVYITIDSDDGCQTGHFIFPHTRHLVRLRAAKTALNILRLNLNV